MSKRPVADPELVLRVKNGRALLHELLGFDYRAEIRAGTTEWKLLLRIARAAHRRGVWPKVRFLIGYLDPQGREVRAYRWRGVQGLEGVKEAVVEAIGAYREAVKALEKVDQELLKVGAVNPNLRPDASRRVDEIRAVLAEELRFARGVPELLIALGTPRPEERLRSPASTRLGLRPEPARIADSDLEDTMKGLGFSDAQIGTLVDGPKGTAEKRATRVRDRRRKRRKSKPGRIES